MLENHTIFLVENVLCFSGDLSFCGGRRCLKFWGINSNSTEFLLRAIDKRFCRCSLQRLKKPVAKDLRAVGCLKNYNNTRHKNLRVPCNHSALLFHFHFVLCLQEALNVGFWRAEFRKDEWNVWCFLSGEKFYLYFFNWRQFYNWNFKCWIWIVLFFKKLCLNFEF